MPSLLVSASDPAEFKDVRATIIERLLETEPFNAGTWQKLDVSASKLHDTYELQQLTFFYPMPQDAPDAMVCIEPDLPWAEGHFLERVAGKAVNPGDWHHRWPYHAGQVQLHQNGGKYDHNYMERFWPKLAGENDFLGGKAGWRHFNDVPHGYRFAIGDLDDVVTLLCREPFTRQAYLPIWFPEDTGATAGQRVPCSLGYHFLIREGALHLTYNLRSCEAYRHFTNDVYMAVRLAQWVTDRVNAHITAQGAQNASGGVWEPLTLGNMHMTVASFHGFYGDSAELEAMLEDTEVIA